MIVTVLRLIIRLTGWLLTPLVVLATAVAGATLGFLGSASVADTTRVLVIALTAGTTGALLGAITWTRMLKRLPGLRQALAVTEKGLPEPLAVQEMINTMTSEEKTPP